MISGSLPLSEVGEVKRFGGKAVNLGKLIQAGLPVPTGFAVSLDAFDNTGKLSVECRKQIKSLLIQDRLYAVRSSATVEDADEASWAGQFETYLNVESAEVIKRIEACHKAIKSRAKAYATQQTTNKKQAAQVAVVVQEMVTAKYAGVMFTRNPSDGSNQILIEYVRGLGESLVHGDADPERIVWSRTKRVIKEQTEQEPPIPASQLIKLAQKIEKSFGVPQDIEWAYDGQQIWIVQSRPITTLQERGVGKHYLGDPAKLFYWGPSRAKPLYISDFMLAFEKFWAETHKNPLLPDAPKTVVLFHDNKVVFLLKSKAFGEFTAKLFMAYERAKRFEQDHRDWQKAVNALDFYAEQGISNTSELSKLLNKCWWPTIFAEFALYGAEAIVTERLKRFEPKIRQEIWGVMTLPDKPTFMQRLDIELAQAKDPKGLAHKYPWIQDGYGGVVGSTEEYFAKRLDIVKDNIELVAGTPEMRQTIIDRYKLTRNEVVTLNLARDLSIFMDERKAWMMRSRQYIAKALKILANTVKLSLTDLEQTKLSDLVHNRVIPCFGQTYLNGTVITLNHNDVALAWDWYIEFRASKAVLSGVVASTGGRHFMNGEAYLVHTPTDPAPDGRVLVVPSTSPSYVPLMRKARALITDHGGMMSHAAIVAREFGLPCIVGTTHATKVLKNGDKVVLDLVKGEVNR